MTRPRKQTVDWFPHYCRHGKTMAILEEKYGNNGYAFWFKLLEILGDTEGHGIDCNNLTNWHYLSTRTHLDEEATDEILNLLAELEAIDSDLWRENRVIWSDNFVGGLTPVYQNRRVTIPAKPCFKEEESPSGGLSPVDNRRVEESNNPSVISTSVDSWNRRLKNGTLPPLNYVLESVHKLSQDQEWMEYPPHATTFLNKGRWWDVEGLQVSPLAARPRTKSPIRTVPSARGKV